MDRVSPLHCGALASVSSLMALPRTYLGCDHVDGSHKEAAGVMPVKRRWEWSGVVLLDVSTKDYEVTKRDPAPNNGFIGTAVLTRRKQLRLPLEI